MELENKCKCIDMEALTAQASSADATKIDSELMPGPSSFASLKPHSEQRVNVRPSHSDFWPKRILSSCSNNYTMGQKRGPHTKEVRGHTHTHTHPHTHTHTHVILKQMYQPPP